MDIGTHGLVRQRRCRREDWPATCREMVPDTTLSHSFQQGDGAQPFAVCAAIDLLIRAPCSARYSAI